MPFSRRQTDSVMLSHDRATFKGGEGVGMMVPFNSEPLAREKSIIIHVNVMHDNVCMCVCACVHALVMETRF